MQLCKWAAFDGHTTQSTLTMTNLIWRSLHHRPKSRTLHLRGHGCAWRSFLKEQRNHCCDLQPSNTLPVTDSSVTDSPFFHCFACNRRSFALSHSCVKTLSKMGVFAPVDQLSGSEASENTCLSNCPNLIVYYVNSAFRPLVRMVAIVLPYCLPPPLQQNQKPRQSNRPNHFRS